MAACLMLSGVGKSGSPAPKSTTSTPSQRSLSASVETFMVEETLIDEIRSAIALIAACIYFEAPFLFFQPGLQPDFDRRRHQAGDIPAERRYLFDQAGAN